MYACGWVRWSRCVSEKTLVLAGAARLLMKMAMVSTRMPGKPFSPKSRMASTDFCASSARVVENSGVLRRNLGKTSATYLARRSDFSRKNEQMLLVFLFFASRR